MRGIFSLDGKLATFLNLLGDLIVLNILTLICCVPVITAGAAVSSMYQITLKMVRHELPDSIFTTYLRVFRGNLRQSTAIWLIGGGVSAFIAADIWLLGKVELSFGQTYQIVLFVLLNLILVLTLFALIVQGRFQNSLKNTVKNGVLFFMMHIVKSLMVYLLPLVPFLLLFLSYRFLSVIVLIGVSGPAYLSSFYLRRLFDSGVTSAQDEMRKGLPETA